MGEFHPAGSVALWWAHWLVCCDARGSLLALRNTAGPAGLCEEDKWLFCASAPLHEDGGLFCTRRHLWNRAWACHETRLIYSLDNNAKIFGIYYSFGNQYWTWWDPQKIRFFWRGMYLTSLVSSSFNTFKLCLSHTNTLWLEEPTISVALERVCNPGHRSDCVLLTRTLQRRNKSWLFSGQHGETQWAWKKSSHGKDVTSTWLMSHNSISLAIASLAHSIPVSVFLLTVTKWHCREIKPNWVDYNRFFSVRIRLF